MHSTSYAFSIFSLLFILVILLGISSCDVSETDASGTLQVWLTDAPADYEAVLIDIQSVRVHKSEEENADNSESEEEAQEEGWATIPYDGDPVNLLELRNGNEMSLGETELESGTYKQVRLVLGENNEVVIDGQSYPLQTPSAQQSGLKLKIDAYIQGGSIYSLLIDFDASRSIVETGNGKYILKPVLRMVELAGAGSIAGTVEPNDFITSVMAINNSDDTLSTLTDEAGNFTILGVLPGTYDVVFKPSIEQFADTTLTSVSVVDGERSNVGTVNLSSIQ